MAGLDPTQAAAEATKTIADLGLTAEWQESGIGEREGNLKAGVEQAETARGQQEPRSYRTQENAAVAHGIASTGMASLAHENLKNRFAAQRTANEARLKEGLAGFKHEREGVQLTKTQGETGAKSRQTQQEADYAAEHPPVTATPAPAAPTYPTPPAQQKAIESGTQPGPGGVVPYESKKVRVGMPPRKSYTPGGK